MKEIARLRVSQIIKKVGKMRKENLTVLKMKKKLEDFMCEAGIAN